MDFAVLLIGNYELDRQESMQRYAACFEAELKSRGVVVNLIKPRVILGGLIGNPFLSKWLGYIDKFIFFPFELNRAIVQLSQLKGPVLVHICDHSNSPYVHTLKNQPHVVTCHDMLAIRKALSRIKGQVGTGFTGRIFQRFIVKGLERARAIVCVSEQTRHELLEGTGVSSDKVSVVYNGLNYNYQPMDTAFARNVVNSLMERCGYSLTCKFILHVGGDSWYKNRTGLIEIYARMRYLDSNTPPLILLGKTPNEGLIKMIADCDVANYVYVITGADNQELNAFYSLADLFIFPSLAEGYGWPVAEALASGCRVLTSDRAPLTEVGGSVVSYANPEDINGFARKAMDMLANTQNERRDQVMLGLDRAQHFRTGSMVDSYLNLYIKILMAN